MSQADVPQAFVYDALRTPRGKGKKNGSLHEVKPIDLVVGLLDAVQERHWWYSARRDVLREVPADRLLIETDSPYLAPVPHRGRRNEPSFVVDVARAVADRASGRPVWWLVDAERAWRSLGELDGQDSHQTGHQRHDHDHRERRHVQRVGPPCHPPPGPKRQAERARQVLSRVCRVERNARSPAATALAVPEGAGWAVPDPIHETVSPAVSARPLATQGKTPTWISYPCSFAASSVRPTDATSGWQYVQFGMLS